MPTYTFKCRKCDKEFEVFQKINDKRPTDCRFCGEPIKQVFHPIGIIFKGSGFYTTDYARKSNKAVPDEAGKTDTSDKPQKPEKTDKSKTDKSKTDKKPAEKTASKGR